MNDRDVESAAKNLGSGIKGLTEQFERLRSENKRLTLALEEEEEKTAALAEQVAALKKKLAARIPGNFHKWTEKWKVPTRAMLELHELFGIK